MTDDLDDLRRRNAEMLKGRDPYEFGRKPSGYNFTTAILDDADEPPRDQETPRRIAADFWNG